MVLCVPFYSNALVIGVRCIYVKHVWLYQLCIPHLYYIYVHIPVLEWYQLLYSYYSYHIANNSSLNFVYSYGICVAAKSKQTLFLIGDYLLKQVLWPMNTVRTVYLNKINYMCFWWLWTDLFTYLFYSKQLCSGLLFIFVVFSCFILCNAVTHCYCCNAIFD